MKLLDAVHASPDLTPPSQIRIRKPPRRQIDIRNHDDVVMWCRRFGVTPLQLCSVIDRVGNDAAVIESAIRPKTSRAPVRNALHAGVRDA